MHPQQHSRSRDADGAEHQTWKLIHFFCIGAIYAAGISLHAQTTSTPALTFVRISNGANGEPSNGSSARPSMSADGRFVVFESDATNLVAGDTNAWRDIFVYERATRILTRESLGPGGVEANGSSFMPSISADGRYVAFGSNATNLVTGITFPANQLNAHIYLRDRILRITTLIDRPMNGTFEAAVSSDPMISDDGRYVAFMSTASNLVADDTNGCADVFVADTITGAVERASVDTGMQGCGVSGSLHPSINGDGRYVAFDSDYSNDGGVTGFSRGIFVRDRVARVTSLASVATDGAKLPGASFPSIGGDGRLLSWNFRVPFRSGTLVRDRAAGVTEQLGVEAFFSPRVSHDAPYVSFVASGLAPHGAFVVDAATRTLVPVAPDGADILEISAVGGNAFAVTTKVALVPAPENYMGDIYVATPAAGGPGAPRNLTASMSGSTMTLSWTPAASGGAPTSYIVAAGSQPGRTTDAILSTGSTATSFSATVSSTGVFYIRIHATNASGTSPPSNEIAVTLGSGIRPPSNLAATIDGSTVTLTWSSPPLGSASFDSFVIEVGSSSGSSNLARFAVRNSFSSPKTYVATAVPPGTYFVRVRTSNGTAVSEPSNEVVVVVP